jgi:hypothetical protein
MFMTGEPPAEIRKADQFEYEDGTVEIVFAVEEGKVLTVREYPDEDTFSRETGGAMYRGAHPGVEELPGLEAFEESDSFTGSSERD